MKTKPNEDRINQPINVSHVFRSSVSIVQRLAIIGVMGVCLGGVTSAWAEPQNQTGYDQWLEHRSQLLKDPSLVAYYDFQEGTGEILRNQVKANPDVDGIIHGATWTNGRWPGKKALKFEGNGYVQIAHKPCLNMFDARTGGTEEVTVEVWTCPSSTQECGLVDKSSEGWGRGAAYAIWISSNSFFGDIGDGNVGQSIKDSLEVVINSWNHVVLTVDHENLTLYKNGMLVSRVDRNLMPIDNGKPLLIGCMKPGLFPYRGLIDEVVLYKRALKESEIRALFKTKQRFTIFIP